MNEISLRLRAMASNCAPVSPITATVLTAVANDHDLGARGGTARLLRAAVRAGPSIPLALAAALHRLVLTGRAPRLARHYPTVGGSLSDPAALRHDALLALRENAADVVRWMLSDQVQTNEPGRSVPLRAGLLAAESATAPETGWSMVRLLELGASAGLNLRPDWYRYDADTEFTSDAAAGLVLPLPPPRFVSRRLERVELRARGCDLRPIDVTDADQRRKLQSYVWPDDPVRWERLRRALALHRRAAERVSVDRAGALQWLTAQMSPADCGVPTVVWHSGLWQYLDAAERGGIVRKLREWGVRSTPMAPLAWLRYEPSHRPDTGSLPLFALKLTLWPGERRVVLGHGDAYGIPFSWNEACR